MSEGAFGILLLFIFAVCPPLALVILIIIMLAR